MRWPNVEEVAHELRALNRLALEGELGVRLQVYPDGEWHVRYGDSGYDLDHHGYWGAATLPGYRHGFDARRMAADMVKQAREDYDTSIHDDDELPYSEVEKEEPRI